jgi:hypothetical protein
MMNSKNENIIIAADHKNALLVPMLILFILVAVKWFIIGYSYGKGRGK